MRERGNQVVRGVGAGLMRRLRGRRGTGGIQRREIRERRKSEKKRCDFFRLRPKVAGNEAGRMRRTIEEMGHGVITNAAFRAGR